MKSVFRKNDFRQDHNLIFLGVKNPCVIIYIYNAIPPSIVSIMSLSQYKISQSQNFEIPNGCHRNWEKGTLPGSLWCVRTYVNHNRTVAERISKNHDKSVAERISKIGSATIHWKKSGAKMAPPWSHFGKRLHFLKQDGAVSAPLFSFGVRLGFRIPSGLVRSQTNNIGYGLVRTWYCACRDELYWIFKFIEANIRNIWIALVENTGGCWYTLSWYLLFVSL